MPDSPFDDTRLTAVGLLVEVYGGLMARLDAAHAAAGLSGTDFDVLIRLARSPDGRLRMSDLAAQTALSTSGITRIVDRLERAGLVARRPAGDDRRGFVAVVTDAGHDRLRTHVPTVERVVDESLVAPLTERQLDGFLDTLRTLRAVLRPEATAGATR